MRQEQFLRYKEWEFITFPLEVVELNDPTGIFSFGPGTSITITRNQDYRLQGKITGFTMNRTLLENSTDYGPGNFVKEQNLEAKTTDRLYKLTLNSCVIRDVTSKGIVYENLGTPFEAVITMDWLILTPVHLPENTEVTDESQWFLTRKFNVHFPAPQSAKTKVSG